jgi:hypothetical protein
MQTALYKIGIMQPYIYPYIGYFQLINSVDVFVIYDDIEYTKKGWINRNRLLQNGKDEYFTIPIKKDSDFLDVKQRVLSDNWLKDRDKLINKIKNSYSRAPQFNEVFTLIEDDLKSDSKNLFEFIYKTILTICKYLEIETKIVISSVLEVPSNLKSSEKVKYICKKLKGSTYINAIGGIDLYRKLDFKEIGIDLFFLKTKRIEYKQFQNDFVPFLSIIDVLMFNDKKSIQLYLNEFELV